MKLILAYDHGLEHGPKDFAGAEWAMDPAYPIKIAKEAKLDGVALQIGVAQDYWHNEVPLILKINGKTNIPEGEPMAGMTSSVAEAKEIGAEAIGYTLYVGSERQDEDLARLAKIRKEAQSAGLPVMLWAYPRGRLVEEKGGSRSVEMIAYAARVAEEMGVERCKLNLPDDLSRLDWIVKSAGKCEVWFAGGSKVSDEELIRRAKLIESSGAKGMVLGRNLWQRKYESAMDLITKIR